MWERNIGWLSLLLALTTGDQTCSPGMCPDQESQPATYRFAGHCPTNRDTSVRATRTYYKVFCLSWNWVFMDKLDLLLHFLPRTVCINSSFSLIYLLSQNILCGFILSCLYFVCDSFYLLHTHTHTHSYI